MDPLLVPALLVLVSLHDYCVTQKGDRVIQHHQLLEGTDEAVKWASLSEGALELYLDELRVMTPFVQGVHNLFIGELAPGQLPLAQLPRVRTAAAGMGRGTCQEWR